MHKQGLTNLVFRKNKTQVRTSNLTATDSILNTKRTYIEIRLNFEVEVDLHTDSSRFRLSEQK